jgi:hypothetical protein
MRALKPTKCANVSISDFTSSWMCGLSKLAMKSYQCWESDSNSSVNVVEISAEFPDGAEVTIKRTVAENARSLVQKSADW